MAGEAFVANPAKTKVARSGAPRLMVTFADLMSLLLALFALLLSFVDLDLGKFN